MGMVWHGTSHPVRISRQPCARRFAIGYCTFVLLDQGSLGCCGVTLRSSLSESMLFVFMLVSFIEKLCGRQKNSVVKKCRKWGDLLRARQACVWKNGKKLSLQEDSKNGLSWVRSGTCAGSRNCQSSPLIMREFTRFEDASNECHVFRSITLKTHTQTHTHTHLRVHPYVIRHK